MSKSKQTEERIKVINLGQHIKRLNFEVIKTPYELSKFKEVKPSIEFKLATKRIELNGNDHEVVLQIEVVSKIDKTSNQIFKVELEYLGVFKLEGESAEEVKDEILLINCVTLLFPFARQKLAEITLSGGYQPIMLEPIDFRNAFFQSKQQNQAVNFETLTHLAR